MDKKCLHPVKITLSSLNIQTCPDCKKQFKLINNGRPCLNVGSSKDRGL